MKRILIADDRASSREFLGAVLEGFGLEVVTANDGAEALALAASAKPDAIILDIHMPGLDGFEVIERLRREAGFAEIPVMALTASAMEGDRARALAAGFDHYMIKPVGLPELREEVFRLLGEKLPE